MFNKDLEEIKKNQSIINNPIIEIKSTLEGTNSGINKAEERISEVEDRMMEINEAERKKELKKCRQFQRPLDNVKHPNILTIGVPEEENEKKGHRKIPEEITVKNFLSM